MYKSPLHILEDFDLNPNEGLDSAALLRLRKKLLAEFDLSNATTIEIKGKHYSKDEIIKTIDVLLGNPQMPLHLFIFENKKLLDFLENDNSIVRPVDVKAILIPQEILPMLAPILLDRYVLNMRKAFHSRNFGVANALLVYSPDFPEEEKMLYHEEINKNLINLQEHVLSVKQNGFDKVVNEYDYLKKNTLAVFLNSLPVDFIDTINGLVAEIINSMVSYQKINRHDKALLYYISSNLLKINCDDELKLLIKSNHRAFTQNYEGVNSSGGSGGGMSTGRVIYIVVILVVFVMRLATCSRNSSSDYKFDNKNYTNILNSLNAERTEYEDFAAYRNHIMIEEGYKSMNAGIAVNLEFDSSRSGNTPFKEMLTRISDYDFQDTAYKRFVIKNNTIHDLIITVFDDYNAKAYYFYKNMPDTLSLYKGQKLCLYFGDSLARIPKPEANSVFSYMKAWHEVYFKRFDSLSKEILNIDFRIVQTDDAKVKKKSKKKKKPLDVIELTDSFFNERRVETKKTILDVYKDESYSQDSLKVSY